MEHNRVIFDTNVWLAFFKEGDSCHVRALESIKQVGQDTQVLFTKQLVGEILTVLRLKGSPQAVQAFHTFFTQDKRCSVAPDEDFQIAYEYFITNDQAQLSFVDTQLLVLSKKNTVVTFDKELEKTIGMYKK